MRPLRLGMVGGGPGAGIAPTHRRAARLDGCYELVAGAFSRNAQSNRAMADELMLALGSPGGPTISWRPVHAGLPGRRWEPRAGGRGP